MTLQPEGEDVNEPLIERLTLREMFTSSERLSRDVIDHLDQGFIPKVQQLIRLVRPTDAHPYPPDIEDVTVRTHSARVLENEDFTDQLYEKLEKYCIAIDNVVSRILNEE